LHGINWDSGDSRSLTGLACGIAAHSRKEAHRLAMICRAINYAALSLLN
jgi:hypothetical protein